MHALVSKLPSKLQFGADDFAAHMPYPAPVTLGIEGIIALPRANKFNNKYSALILLDEETSRTIETGCEKVASWAKKHAATVRDPFYGEHDGKRILRIACAPDTAFQPGRRVAMASIWCRNGTEDKIPMVGVNFRIH